MYSLTDEEFDDNNDQVKAAVLRALVAEGVMEVSDADRWSANHTVIRVRKSIFRTISDWWRKETAIKGGRYLVVVKLVVESEREET